MKYYRERKDTLSQINHNIIARVQVYNEETLLPTWIEKVNRYCSNIIAYNDGSTDGTMGILSEALPPECILNSDVNAHHLESHYHRDMFYKVKEVCELPAWIWCSATDEWLPDYPDLIKDLNAILDMAESLNKSFVVMNNAELFLSEHWYATHAKFSGMPFMRFYKQTEDMEWPESELVDHAHCKTHPKAILTGNREFKINPEGLMTLHYGYVDMERIIRRYIKMCSLWEQNKYNPVFMYHDWVRGIDLRDVELKHLPKRWIDGGCKGCKKPVFENDCMIKPGEHFIESNGAKIDVYDYWKQFKNRRYTERL